MSTVVDTRGVKRKRGDVAQEDNTTAKVKGKLHHGLREVRKAAKKARTFETQKLVKKLKASRSENADAAEIAEMEAQLASLKQMDIDGIGNLALRSKVKRDRVLSGNVHVQAAIAAELTSNIHVLSPAGTSACKIESRLLSSKALASEVHSVLDALKETLQPGTRKKPQDVDEAEVDSNTSMELPQKARKVNASMSKRTLGSSDEDSDDGHDEAERQYEEWEAGSVHDSGSKDDHGWESGSVDEGEPRLGGPAASDNDSDDNSTDEDDDSRLPHRAPSSGKKGPKSQPVKPDKGKSKSTDAESAFLPSLAVGYTRGDSDASGWSDEEEEPSPKKNRRGQRARRAIWEKKYGKNANHVKKVPEGAAQGPRQKVARHSAKKDATHHPRTGAANASSARSQYFVPSSRDSGWSKARQSAAEERPQAGRKQMQTSDKPLHPSWEAKKKLKEKLNPSIVPAQGKKTTF